MAPFYQRLATGSTVRRSKPGGDKILRSRPDWPWGLPSLLYNWYRVSFSGVKWPRRAIDHPPHLAPRVKKEYSYTSTLRLGLHGMFWGKHYLYLILAATNDQTVQQHWLAGLGSGDAVCFPLRRNCSCKIYASRLCQGSGFKSPASHRLRPGFNPRSNHVRFLVDQVTIGQVLPRVFRNGSVSMVTTLRPGRYGV